MPERRGRETGRDSVGRGIAFRAFAVLSTAFLQAMLCCIEGGRLDSQDAQRWLAQIYERGLPGQTVDKTKAARLRRQSNRDTAAPL